MDMHPRWQCAPNSATILPWFPVLQLPGELGRILGRINDAPDSTGPGSYSLRTRRGIVRLCACRSILACRTCPAVAISDRRSVLRRTGSARAADLQRPMRGMSRECDGRHDRPPAGRSYSSLELEQIG